MIGDRTYSASLTTPAGDTIYNAGMDYWTTYNVTGSCSRAELSRIRMRTAAPCSGSAAITKTPMHSAPAQRRRATTVRNVPCSAPGIATGENFAAGNLFTGTFECGTGMLDMFGYARFGVKYMFTARPKALRVHYKATIDKVTHAGKTGLTTNDYDYAKIFVCITDWSARHSVKSGVSYDETTFWSPNESASLSEGAILGYSSKLIMESTAGWSPRRSPIEWYAPEPGAHRQFHVGDLLRHELQRRLYGRQPEQPALHRGLRMGLLTK